MLGFFDLFKLNRISTIRDWERNFLGLFIFEMLKHVASHLAIVGKRKPNGYLDNMQEKIKCKPLQNLYVQVIICLYKFLDKE
ncbi:hypothetical protein EAF29_09625 [Staphylococcus pseudintermedius]|nr:hypothetical protein [Staphylococcus pseudintermedius]EGQ1731407.1 hypothetical protein [Staphylococcus pseudintermedius]EGQ2919901.1 hypothetical protein [Staphylococcus pseudintermedius]EGQ2959885.1 hypothetical protein [Staphylococcus pseudintermedius]EGQ4381436.1 hypothetical protein [Staphylococcus pseudintermedius]